MKTQSTILGFIGNQPNAVTFESGRSLVRFSVAVNEYKAQGKTTTWYDIQAWNELGAEIYAHVAKGRKVKVVGRPTLNSYTDKEGNQVTKNVINVDHIEFIAAGGSTTKGTEEKQVNLAFESAAYEQQMQSA